MRFRDRFDRKKRTKSTVRQRIGFAFFWLLVVAYGYFIPTDPNFNSESHLYLAFSIVDRHSLNIDRYHQYLGDQSYWQGHYYSDKAPGISLLAVPFYAALRLVFPSRRGEGYQGSSKRGYWRMARDTTYLRYSLTLLILIMPSALFAVLVWLFLGEFLSPTWSLLLAGTYAVGTIAYPMSTWLFSHQITAMLLFGAFLLIYHRDRRGAGRSAGSRHAALAGLLAGYSVISEYPTAVIAVLIAGYLAYASQNRVRDLAVFIGGMLPPLLLNLWYDTAAFGRPFATGYMFVRSSMYHHHIAGTSLGLANPLSYGIQPPSFFSLGQITFGTFRGIFPVNSVLLLFFPGVVLLWKQRRDLRAELMLCLAIVVLYFLLDAARPENINGWAGGRSVASRHLTPIIPFMLVPIAFCLRRRLGQCAFLLLGGLSVALMFATASETLLYGMFDQNPIVHEVIPKFMRGDFAVNWGYFLGLSGFRSLIPFGILAGLLVLRITWLLRRREARVPATVLPAVPA